MNLKDVLRNGDPAADDPGLSPEEVQAMRRTVLSAVPEPRRRGWLVPVAVGAVLILAALVGLSLWRQPAQPTRLAEERAVAPSPAQRGRVGEGAPSSISAPKDPLPVPPHVNVARVVHPRPRPVPKPEPDVELARTESQQQQIQFSTPGGTRVIWVLNRTAE